MGSLPAALPDPIREIRGQFAAVRRRRSGEKKEEEEEIVYLKKEKNNKRTVEQLDIELEPPKSSI